MQAGRASRTAEMVAARRAAHQQIDRPLVFEDPLAARVVAPELLARMDREPRRFKTSRWARFLRAALAVRSRYAEDELRAAVGRGIRQYVLLGAGLDTFAYRSPFPDVRVFEVDHPDTQAVKRRRLKAAGIAIPDPTTFVPIDFATTALEDGLRAAGFDMRQPSFFAWLGVVPYLDRQAIVATLRVIASLPRGTAVVFDYGATFASLGWFSRFVVWRVHRKLKAIGEPIQSTFTPPQIIALMKEAGFRDVEDLGHAELNRRYLAGRTDGLRIGEAMHIVKGTV
jgi:methyltransferase (TIGR00027 family)